MQLKYIVDKLNIKQEYIDHKINGICDNSNDCVDGSIFFAINESYIHLAIMNGARTIVCEKVNKKFIGINFLFVSSVKKYLALFCKIYYKDISKKINIIGVVGTNGKTTVTTLGYNFFNYLGLKSMVIGSNGIILNGAYESINNTTPGIIKIYKKIVEAIKYNIKYLFIEISSAGIDQYRTFGLDIDCLIFTNFSQDHLDYHKTMGNYLFCKMLPFIKLKQNGYAIINNDDAKYEELVKYVDSNIYTYGLNKADYLGTINKINENGISFYYNNILYRSKLLGDFNIYNCLSIIPLCDIYHIPHYCYLGFLAGFSFVDGRMNKIRCKDSTVIIDYAHTFEAVKKAVDCVRKICRGNLYIIIGCGGNREKEKRGLIGEYLNTVDAGIVLTSDNPRFEEPLDIINDIKKTITKDVEIIVDRKEAIISTLNKMKKYDYLLILGKGSERYIEVKGEKIPYSDAGVINEYIINN